MWREAAVSFFVAGILAPTIATILWRIQLVDRPNHRSSHRRPTPRGGGLALVIGALAATITSSHLVGPPRTALVLVTLGLGGLGFTEDLYGVPAKTRLLAQLGMGVVVLPSLAYSMGGSSLWQIVFAAGAVAWIAAYVNAFNFMDGINGISAAQAFFAGVVWWLIGERAGVGELAAIGAIAAGVALAFVPVNFPKAAVFLGDVGSYFLGGWLAVGVVLGIRAGIAPVCVLSPMALYLADTSVTIVQRYRRGEAILEAHRSHAYQRLVALGWSHMHAVFVVSAGIVTCGAAGYWALDGGTGRRAIATVIVVTEVAVYLCLPADVARRQRKHERTTAQPDTTATGSSVVA